MTASLLALFLPVLAALPAVAWSFRAAGVRVPLGFAVCLAAGLGCGASSCTYFLWLTTPGAASIPLPAAEIVAFGTAALLGLLGFHRASQVPVSPARALAGPLGRWLAVGAAVVIVAAVVALAGRLYWSPYGELDAIAVWNLRARFLFRGGPGGWLAGSIPELAQSHPDYPLLLPASVARLWVYAAADDTLAPRLIAFIFTAATAGLVGFALAALRSPTQGLLAAATLLGTRPFLAVGTLQYADVPLAFFLVAALTLNAFADIAPGRRGGLVALAGAAAAFAAWTKNEGLLALAALAAVRILALLRRAGPRGLAAESGWWLAGALPVLAVVADFKLRFAPANDLLAHQSWRSLWEQVTGGARYATILSAFGRHLAAFGGGLLFFIAAYAVLAGRRPKTERGPGAGQPALVVLLLLVGYFVVYLTTYWKLPQHLAYSLDRLIVQVYPSALFAVFLATATPAAHRPRPVGLERP